MSSTVLETMILRPCQIPLENLVEMAREYDGYDPTAGNAEVASAIDALRWSWKHHEPGDRTTCPYPHVVCLDGRLFEVEGFKSTDDLWLSKLTERPDGSFEYTALYYNGAAHWAELAEADMRKLRSPDTGEGG